jgi:hypothetical protein
MKLTTVYVPAEPRLGNNVNVGSTKGASLASVGSMPIVDTGTHTGPTTQLRSGMLYVRL